MTSTDLISLAVNFVCFTLYYITIMMFMHTFYDDAIALTKKKIIIFMILLVANYVLSILIPNLVFKLITDNEKIYNMTYLLMNYVFYIVFGVYISYRKKAGIKKGILRFLVAIILFVITNYNITLVIFLVNFCISKIDILHLTYYTLTNKDLLILDSIRAVSLTAFTLYLYFGYYKKKLTMRMRKIDVFFMIMYAVFIIFMNVIFGLVLEKEITISTEAPELKILLAVTMLILIIAVPIVMMRGRVNAHFKQLSAYQQTFLETELNASRQYKAAQEDTRAFRHDVQNNLSVVAMLMEQGKVAEAQQYLNDMRTEVNALSPKVVTGDEMLDSLVSSKMAKMEELGIKFKLDGVIDGGLDWKPMDTCKVFANLLDNAIEAASKTEEPFIELTFKKTDHHRLVRASNSCIGDVDCEKLMSGEGRVTSKEDKSLHGYGVGNIRKTVEKYGGMMRLTCKDKVFTMELILQK